MTDLRKMAEAVKVAEKAAAKYLKKAQEMYSDELIDRFRFASEACAWISAELNALAATPPGMVCVPVEPTKEMCEAAEALPAIDGVNDLPLAKAGWSPRAIQNLKRYRAMLAAHGGKE